MIPRFPVYVFDVDGTLLDSAEDICGAVRQTLAGTDCGPLPFEFLKSYIGRHLLDLFGDIFPNYTPEQIDALIQQYRSHYPARGHKLTRVYPGVVESLEALGGRKSIATTKGTPTTRLILEQFGLLRFFDHVQGTDGFPCKPAPDVILRSIGALAADPGECLMVGDRRLTWKPAGPPASGSARCATATATPPTWRVSSRISGWTTCANCPTGRSRRERFVYDARHVSAGISGQQGCSGPVARLLPFFRRSGRSRLPSPAPAFLGALLRLVPCRALAVPAARPMARFRPRHPGFVAGAVSGSRCAVRNGTRFGPLARSSGLNPFARLAARVS